MGKITTFGEIMLRLSTEGFLRFSQATNLEVVYGGSESNVAVSLANFGLDVDFVTRLPNNEIAQCAVMELKKYGVNTQNIVYGGERMGIYFLETGAISRGSKVVYDRDYSSMATLTPGMIDWDTVFTNVSWFHVTGITPALSQNAASACLEAVKIAKEKGITISADLNYRSKLWNYCNPEKRQEIMSELTSYCDILLCNQEDAEVFLNIYPTTSSESSREEAILSVINQLFQKFPNLKKVATTLRTSISASHNSWAALISDKKNVYKSRTYELTPIVDRVGGGDSFMAGLIYGLNVFSDDTQKTIDFATAASCLKHSIKGDVNLVSVEEVMKLMQGDESGKVSR